MARLLEHLTFWRSARDSVGCTVLAPPVLNIGELVTLPMFAHCDPTAAVVVLGRAYFPDHHLAGTTSLNQGIARGDRLELHLALPGIKLASPSQEIVWRGQTQPFPFTFRMPSDVLPGEIDCTLTIRRHGDVIMNFEFPLFIGHKQRDEYE
jgi:hypothetical protein